MLQSVVIVVVVVGVVVVVFGGGLRFRSPKNLSPVVEKSHRGAVARSKATALLNAKISWITML